MEMQRSNLAYQEQQRNPQTAQNANIQIPESRKSPKRDQNITNNFANAPGGKYKNTGLAQGNQDLDNSVI
jgi:hypothetical protein